MVGVDLSRIYRFKKVKRNLIEKILHPKEILEYDKLSKKDKPKYLASRWAIKEAIFKADNQYFFFNQILIIKTLEGRYLFEGFEISTSNEGDLVIAFVIKKQEK
ncbi:4'-phosphopantetheinyl transferase superfamily protein [Metamycoplasma neophronis]|uniref:4'-phosphopantetheinyl transferase superfamily protein n=1 Tax=Metamycoplasma neophronis TaxID=872983 RepID=A0ABY2Z0V2_9BACT|nr:4'-phosphopantetheinyl transferase superfamily protein [Metamycoplasma neophronis]TPR54317.1 4'-phosphopantetheinyl transferase superfamily protein [Metamycoplasma neophronis]